VYILTFCQLFREYQFYRVKFWYLRLSSLPAYVSVIQVCAEFSELNFVICVDRHFQYICQLFREYQNNCVKSGHLNRSSFPVLFLSHLMSTRSYWAQLAICVYLRLPTFKSVFSYVPDLLGWVGYLCLSSFTDLFVKFFICTRLTGLSWLFVFIVIYRSFCQVFRMYQTYCVELTICVYRFLPTFLSSFSYVPDLLCWVDYLCLSSFINLFVKFFVCTRLTVLSWLFVFIVIYRSFCQVFRMYQTYCVELAICVYRHLPTFLSSFSYVPGLLGWVGYLCLSPPLSNVLAIS
jgi:hypothetical protein